MKFPDRYRHLRPYSVAAALALCVAVILFGGLWWSHSRAHRPRTARSPQPPIARRAARTRPSRIRIGLRRPSRRAIVELWLSAPARLRDERTGASLAVLPAGKPVTFRARADWGAVACSAP